MVAQVQAKWANLPDVAQRWAKAGGLIVGVLAALGFGFRLDAVMGSDLEPRVVRIEARLDTLRFEASRDRAYIYTELEFMSCERKAANGMDGLTLAHCIEEYRRRTQPGYRP